MATPLKWKCPASSRSCVVWLREEQSVGIEQATLASRVKELFFVEKWHAAKPERIARVDHVRTRQQVGRLHISSCEAGVEAWYTV